MPIVNGLNFTQHGWERAQERDISIEDIMWAMNGARQGIEEGRTLCQRWYTRTQAATAGVYS